MAPTTWVGTAGGRKQVKGIWVGTASGRREVQKVWVGDANGVPKLVYSRGPALTTTLSAAAASTSQINLSWTATSGCTYKLYRTSGPSGTGPLPNGSTALSYNDTGLAANTSYSYRLDVFYQGTLIGSPTVSAKTQAVPPTSTGSVNGPALSSSGGWTQSTARTLNGPLFNITGYVTSFNVYVGGYGVTGSFNPWVGSTRLGWRDVPNGKAWRHVDGGNVAVSGSVRLGADAGGSGKPATAWQTYSGAVWNYNVAVGTVNYWFYTRGADGRSVQADEPWWRPEYDGIDIHVESWVDEAGEWTRAVVHDKATGDVIGSWERE